jgi:hypothetical protein
MSPYTIHLRSENPDLLVEFDLPPGSHARIGASPQAEITLPLGGIPPFSCTVGRFHDGRLYFADLDGTISRRLDLPGMLSLPPYHFDIIHPEEVVEAIASSDDATAVKKPKPQSLLSLVKFIWAGR